MLGTVDRELRLPDRRCARRRRRHARCSRRADALAARGLSFARRARRARLAVPSHRRRAGRAGGGGELRRRRADRRLRGAIHAGSGAARLPDLRAGTRRSRARARRGDGLRDDAAAPARVRACAPRRGHAVARRRASAPRPRAPSRADARVGIEHRRRCDRRRRRSRRRPRAADAAPAADVVPLPTDPAAWPGVRRAVSSSPAWPRNSPRRPSSSRSTATSLTLALPATHKHLADKAYADKLKVALEHATGRKLLLAFEVGDAPHGVARRDRSARARARRKAQREAAFRDEPFVRDARSTRVRRRKVDDARFDHAGSIASSGRSRQLNAAYSDDPRTGIDHDEEPARRPHEAGAADAGQHEAGAGGARADRGRGPGRRGPGQGRR